MGTLDDEFVAPPPRERVTGGEVLLAIKLQYEEREQIKLIALKRHMSVRDFVLGAIELQARVWREEEERNPQPQPVVAQETSIQQMIDADTDDESVVD